MNREVLWFGNLWIILTPLIPPSSLPYPITYHLSPLIYHLSSSFTTYQYSFLFLLIFPIILVILIIIIVIVIAIVIVIRFIKPIEQPPRPPQLPYEGVLKYHVSQKLKPQLRKIRNVSRRIVSVKARRKEKRLNILILESFAKRKRYIYIYIR